MKTMIAALALVLAAASARAAGAADDSAPTAFSQLASLAASGSFDDPLPHGLTMPSSDDFLKQEKSDADGYTSYRPLGERIKIKNPSVNAGSSCGIDGEEPPSGMSSKEHVDWIKTHACKPTASQIAKTFGVDLNMPRVFGASTDIGGLPDGGVGFKLKWKQ